MTAVEPAVWMRGAVWALIVASFGLAIAAWVAVISDRPAARLWAGTTVAASLAAAAHIIGTAS